MIICEFKHGCNVCAGETKSGHSSHEDGIHLQCNTCMCNSMARGQQGCGACLTHTSDRTQTQRQCNQALWGYYSILRTACLRGHPMYVLTCNVEYCSVKYLRILRTTCLREHPMAFPTYTARLSPSLGSGRSLSFFLELLASCQQ